MKTAVEWLVEQLNQSIGLTKFVNNCDEDYISGILGIIEQAKEMEKQQIIDAVKSTDYIIGATDKESEEFAQQYYNETFKSE